MSYGMSWRKIAEKMISFAKVIKNCHVSHIHVLDKNMGHLSMNEQVAYEWCARTASHSPWYMIGINLIGPLSPKENMEDNAF